jgi:hypothetical protein
MKGIVIDLDYPSWLLIAGNVRSEIILAGMAAGTPGGV